MIERILRAWYGQTYGDQVYVRARREARFCWYYPPWLFEHVDLHVVARYDYVRVGENDAIQLGLGWSACDTPAGSAPMRWIAGTSADAYIKTKPAAARLAVDLHRGAADLQSLRVHVSPYPAGGSPFEVAVDVALAHDDDTVFIDVPQASTAAAWRIRLQLPAGRTKADGVALRTIRWTH